MRPRVLLDCDGVLADFIGGVLPIVERITGLKRTHAEVTRFDFCESLGLSKEHGSAVKREIGAKSGFAAGLDPLPGAIDGVKRLREIADITIVTSPWNSNATWTHDREKWLARYFDIHHRDVIHTSAKHLVHGNVFVDDKASTVADWRGAAGDRSYPSIAVLWATPHNQLDSWDGATACSWEQLHEYVERMGGLR